MLDQLLAAIKQKSTEAPFSILFFDYDGTLSPIVSDPKKAFLADQIRDSLIALNSKENASVGIVTGRSLQAIQDFVQIKDLLYITNHGNLTVQGDQVIDKTPHFKELPDISPKYQDLLRDIQNIDPRVYIEEKEVSTAFHYRNVTSIAHELLKDDITARIESQLSNDQVFLTEGKKVLEIFPANTNKNKGTAILSALDSFQENNPEIKQLMVSFIGDDVTDEDGFIVLNTLDQFTIKVGAGDTAARYRLSDTDEVQAFIQQLAKIL